MKKLYVLLVAMTFILVTGCTKVEEGKYAEGTYFGFDEVSKHTAVIYVDDKGMIKSAIIDAVYGKKQPDGTTVYTTKQILGDAYGMKPASSNMGVIEGGAEWYTQVNNFAAKVVEEQGLDWFEFKYRVTDVNGKTTFTDTTPTGQTEADKLYTDSVAGVTMHADASYNAIKNALDKAKK